MRQIFATLMILCLSGPANAGPKEDALIVVEQFKKAYDASDPAAIVKLFAPDAVFLGTLMQRPTRDPATILKYFQTSAQSNLPKKIEIENYETLQLSDTAILLSGQDTFYSTQDGKVVDAPARFTFLITKGTQGWQFSHFHSSRRPPPPK